MIVNCDVFVEIRMARNDIAHEYLPEVIRGIVGKVLALAPHLLDGPMKKLLNVTLFKSRGWKATTRFGEGARVAYRLFVEQESNRLVSPDVTRAKTLPVKH